MLIDGHNIIELGYAWRERDGSEHRVQFSGSIVATKAEIEARAREHGWPGHSGRFSDYLKDDLRKLWRKLIPLT